MGVRWTQSSKCGRACVKAGTVDTKRPTFSRNATDSEENRIHFIHQGWTSVITLGRSLDARKLR